eukprot:NODE_2614_length_571_cov_1250.739464_g1999_i2.p1 GENE.NODE_2614_length_571_cov_1250.739464_g1999_i2~~NODE_2614_length_571_cov_1250.739464_g1999_i2.p1  ORF type:complete len:129 (-),score=20.07 NODE_2614_length_571_cov_1250.739464_g1999_i2:153-539(-)
MGTKRGCENPEMRRALISLSAPATSARLFQTSPMLFAIKKGTTKWFDGKKGYGFITPTDGSPDIFVHQSSIKASGFRSLGDGEEVEFEIEVDASGRSKAKNVTGPGGVDVKGAPPRREFGSRPRRDDE